MSGGQVFEIQQPGEIVAVYPTYSQAQAAVDRLSDAKFDLSAVQIVGTGLRSVEQVTGRVTKGRAALYGAGSGAWFGLFVGLLFALFAPGALWLWPVLGAVLIGAFWGALFGFIAHAATGGQRDFASVKGLAAREYCLSVDARLAPQAAQLVNS